MEEDVKPSEDKVLDAELSQLKNENLALRREVAVLREYARRTTLAREQLELQNAAMSIEVNELKNTK
jgi:hypothetical protein